MDISASHLRVFETVAREGNITSAASRLGLTQPAVTRSLQKLEKELEVDLFIRSRKGVILTRAGRQLNAAIKRLLTDFSQVQDSLRKEAELLQGVYSIGVHADLAGLTLPKFVASLLEAYPLLELTFEHALSREITRRVALLELDFGIVVNPLQFPDLTIRKLYQVQVGFWMSKNSPWGGDLTQKGIPIICNPESMHTLKLLKQVTNLGIFPAPRFVHTTSLQLVSSLTASGAGIGIIPETEVKHHYYKKLIPVSQLPIYKDEICLVYRKDMLRGTPGAVIRDSIINSLQKI
jgi:DNA-binding transcriptional LysR family regulator